MKRLAVLLVALGTAIFCCGISQATLINVDFGTTDASSDIQSGAAVIGSSGDTWNGFTTGSETDLALVDAGAQSTGVTMSYSNNGGGVYYGSTAFTGGSYEPLMEDYLYGAMTTAVGFTVTLSGLEEGDYELYLYSLGASTNRIATFTATTSVGSTSVTIGPAGSIGTFVEEVNYGVLQVAVGSSDALTIQGAATNAAYRAQLNGFQLTPVPEPTSMALMSLVALGLLSCVWRR